jgi:hypothetical protein
MQKFIHPYSISISTFINVFSNSTFTSTCGLLPETHSGNLASGGLTLVHIFKNISNDYAHSSSRMD